MTDGQQAGVAVTGTVANLVAIKNNDLATSAGQEIRSGEADNAGADNDRPWSRHARIVGTERARVRAHGGRYAAIFP